ncbi:host specificity protein J [Pseudomonas moorei]|uniref:Phage-related protein, tail component n=1 Tax=Pseudomonas moorei TaxID=395599 RepID=A0A1H1FH26_9PSED|nr:phage tail protein [Pseudomonas moorei]KAB0509694.1 host specificity protein J [Pseudomonas moorei]SDR00251.1 Phage-related protein, tail component [Pseudomonas moorei]
MSEVIVGRKGGGKGGGSSSGSTRAVVEAPDSLRSRQHVQVLHAIGEGEIEGIVGGYQGVFFDDVPLQNFDGSLNFSNVLLETRPGTQWQTYLPVTGLEAEQSVGVELKSGVAIERAITDTDADAVRVTISVPQLSEQNMQNGDTTGSSVTFRIEGRLNNNAWYPLCSDLTITGKTMSRTQFSYYLRLSVSVGLPRYIRVTRLSADSGSAAIQNRTFFDSFTLLWDEKLRYPNTALCGVSIDAQQFSSIPRMSFLVRGIKVLVPSNYNPFTRVYTGSWNGTFQRVWTDNPAWIWYDMLTNTRYGLGGLLDSALIDKFALYSIAQYCDALVPDGYGGLEPRFTCNLALTTQQDAWKLVNDMVSVFRAISFWAGGTLTAVQDAPRSSRYLFNNSNVVGGDFSYQSVASDQRYNVAGVTWNDPLQQYKQSVEIVERPDLIAKWGRVQQSDVVAIGCTSRGQARRLGRWLLYAESEAVTFAVGADGAIPLPGDIIDIADANRAGARNGGRLLAGSTTTTLLLDAPIGSGGSGLVAVILPDGTYASRTMNVLTGATALVVSPPLPAAPLASAPWAFSATTLDTQKFRVIGISEGDDGTYAISAVAFDPDKFNQVEFGTPDTDNPISNVNLGAPAAMGQLTFLESLYDTGTGVAAARLTVSWTQPARAMRYQVEVMKPGGNWEYVTEVSTPSIEFDSASSGLWSVRVTPKSVLGLSGQAALQTYNAQALLAPPSALSGLRLDVINSVATLAWDPVPELDVKLGGSINIRQSRSTLANWDSALPLTEAAGRSTSAVVSLLPGKYLARAVDSSGVGGPITEVWSDAQVPLPDNVVLTVTESPAFSGVAVNAAASDGVLKMAALGLFDDIPSLDTWLGEIDKYGGSRLTMTYSFAAPSDLGYVYDCRLTANVEAALYDDGSYIDTITDFDSMTSIDGDPPVGASLSLWVRTSDVFPAVWSAWKPFVVGDYRARLFDFQLRGEVQLATNWIDVSTLEVTIDMPDRIESGNDLAVPALGLTITYAPPFKANPAVSLTAQGLSPGDYLDVSAKTATGFTVFIRNSSGVAQSGRSIDYISKGY